MNIVAWGFTACASELRKDMGGLRWESASGTDEEEMGGVVLFVYERTGGTLDWLVSAGLKTGS